jgi:hypothetical protein
VPTFQGQIDAQARADGDCNGLGFRDRESRGAGGDGVNTNAQFRNFVVAGWIALDHRGDAGGIVPDGNGHVRNRCAARVMNGPDQAAKVVLGKSCARRKHQQKRHGKKDPTQSRNAGFCRAGWSGL